MNVNAIRRRFRRLAALAAFALLLSLSAEAQAITMSFSPVGNAGNAPDPATGNLYGSVGYNYSIGTYDVTLGQYAAFLNAVAGSDLYGAYDSSMATAISTQGITQSGSPGSYTYATFGNPNMPVFDVSWGDAARFANWLQNSQPTNLGEAAGSTETGAYTLNGATSNAALMAVTRNSTATIFLPNENEWYKAAYYNAAANNGSYWEYPTQSNSVPSNMLSPTGTNNANYAESDPTNLLTPVGYFAGSPGPYGAYDMGGDVFQWDEMAIVAGTTRGLRGGSWLRGSLFLSSSDSLNNVPTYELNDIGFRVASLPEPGSITLMLAGAAGLLIWRKRRNA